MQAADHLVVADAAGKDGPIAREHHRQKRPVIDRLQDRAAAGVEEAAVGAEHHGPAAPLEHHVDGDAGHAEIVNVDEIAGIDVFAQARRPGPDAEIMPRRRAHHGNPPVILAPELRYLGMEMHDQGLDAQVPHGIAAELVDERLHAADRGRKRRRYVEDAHGDGNDRVANRDRRARVVI